MEELRLKLIAWLIKDRPMMFNMRVDKNKTAVLMTLHAGGNALITPKNNKTGLVCNCDFIGG